MKKLLAASLVALTSVTTANAANISLNDAYIGMDLGMLFPSWKDVPAGYEDYLPQSAFMLGFDIGAKFLPLDRVYNPGLSLGYNLSFPTEPSKSYTKQKPAYTFWTLGVDFDNYFAIANRNKPDSRTDLIAGAGLSAVTVSVSGGGMSDSSTTMAMDFKFGVDQGISESLKLTARMHVFFPLDSDDVGMDALMKMSIGFKSIF